MSKQIVELTKDKDIWLKFKDNAVQVTILDGQIVIFAAPYTISIADGTVFGKMYSVLIETD